MVLMLVETVPPGLLGRRGAYSYISLMSIVLVYWTEEQCKQKLSLVTCKYIACSASHTLILTEYSSVAREHLIHKTAYHELTHDTNTCLKNSYRVHEKTATLQENGVQCFYAKH